MVKLSIARKRSFIKVDRRGGRLLKLITPSKPQQAWALVSQSRSTTSHALYLHRKTEKERAGESQVDWHHFLQECSD